MTLAFIRHDRPVEDILGPVLHHVLAQASHGAVQPDRLAGVGQFLEQPDRLEVGQG